MSALLRELPALILLLAWCAAVEIAALVAPPMVLAVGFGAFSIFCLIKAFAAALRGLATRIAQPAPVRPAPR